MAPEPATPDVAARVLPKVTQRLVAFAFICYVVAYIDRVNIGFVNAILQRRLGLSNEEFGWGAGLFFFGYFLFEIPGLTEMWDLEPDLVTSGKSIAGGVPFGAYGMTDEVAAVIEQAKGPDGERLEQVATGGTLFGNALSMAAARATMLEILTPDAYVSTRSLGARLAESMRSEVERAGLPWHIHHLGPRSGYTFRPTPVRDAREARACRDDLLTRLIRVWLANRGVWDAIVGAGPVVPVPATEEDVDAYLAAWGELVGALTLEALSRGAAFATFIDRDAAAVRLVRANVTKLGEGGRTRALETDALHPPRADAPCSLVSLDPPYHEGLAAPALAARAAAGWLAEGAIAVVETATRDDRVPPAGFRVADERRYGKAKVTFLVFTPQA